MSKVVILAINARYSHSSLAAWLLAESVRQRAEPAHDVAVIEANINQDVREIAQLILVEKPDVVGISLYIWNARSVLNLLKDLASEDLNAAIVLGGPEASTNAEYWLENGADYVVAGEGEAPFPALLDKLSKGKAPPRIIKGEPLENPINPYTGNFFKNLGSRIAYIESSRGCPFSCSFCLSGSSASGVRFFPLGQVLRQIDALIKSDSRTIKFVDRTFNCHAERAFKIFEYVIYLDTEHIFHFEIAADLLDDRTIGLLKTAPPGRIKIETGLQSFHAKALEAVGRKTDLARAAKNIKELAKSKNIHIHADLIAGLPYEGLDDFMDSFDKSYQLKANSLQLGFLKLLHGSRLRDEFGGIIKFSEEPPYEITESPWLGASGLNILKIVDNALNHTHNKSRFPRTLQYVLGVTKTRPFTLFQCMGTAAPHRGRPLGVYAEELFSHFIKLRGVCGDRLLREMILDWLSMVKGRNMPPFLKMADKNEKARILAHANEALGRTIRKDEAALLPVPNGGGAYVDSEKRCKVTGLYEVTIIS